VYLRRGYDRWLGAHGDPFGGECQSLPDPFYPLEIEGESWVRRARRVVYWYTVQVYKSHHHVKVQTILCRIIPLAQKRFQGLYTAYSAQKQTFKTFVSPNTPKII